MHNISKDKLAAQIRYYSSVASEFSWPFLGSPCLATNMAFKIFSKLICRQVHISYCFLFESLKILSFLGVKPVFKTAYDLCGKQEKVLDPGDFHQIYTTFIQWVLIVLI